MLLLVLCVSSALAEDAADEATKKLSAFGTICEKSEIWTLLTSDPTVNGVRNINWATIQALANSQISAYEHDIKVKAEGIEKLTPRIAEAIAKERIEPATAEAVDNLIITALNPSFTSVDKAKETECGKPSAKHRDRKLRGAYRKATDEMEKVAAEFFKGESSLSSSTFQVRCQALLGDEGWCPELCQELLDKANEQASAPPVTDSAALQKEQETLKEAKLDTEEKLAQCREAQEELRTFQQDLEGRVATVKERFADYREAARLLDDAMNNLMDVEDNMTEHKGRLNEVLKELEADDYAVQEAKKALEASQQAEAALGEEVNQSTNALADLQTKLDSAKNADDVIEKLRAAVSAVTLNMWLYYSKTALEPPVSQGLSLETKLIDYFVCDIKSLEAAGAMEKAVATLDIFCKDEAMPAFRDVSKVDLSPLCQFGEVSIVNEELYATVNSRIQDVQKTVRNVISWMDPYKGQSEMTEDKAGDLVSKGEPKGLRQIVGVYQRAQFFQYLKDWQFGGAYLALIAKLKDMTEALKASLDAVMKELEDLKEKNAAATQAREEAEEKLKMAMDGQQASMEVKAQLEKAIEELEAQTNLMKSLYDDLDAKVKAAWKAFKEAETHLQDAHKEGISFLESFGTEESVADMERALDMLQAKNRLSVLEEELAMAKENYEALQEHIAVERNGTVEFGAAAA